jgi:L-ascorbate metabolism protein UlaG (beta-lactamase superfamily)
MRTAGLSVVVLILAFSLCGCSEKEPAARAPAAPKAPDAEKEATMTNTLQWLGHATFRIAYQDDVIYIDPWKVEGSPKDGTIVLVSHSHYDHYSPEDIKAVSRRGAELIASADVIEKEGRGKAMMPGQTVEVRDIVITAVAAYNPGKKYHPKANNWLGFVIQLGPERIYYAGDTDMTEEMKALEDIDIALLPIGGTYTMNADQAAEAVSKFKPKRAIPYHWGDIVGSEKDARRFAEKADCEVTIFRPGDEIPL